MTMNIALWYIAYAAALSSMGIVAKQDDLQIPIVVHLCDGSIGTLDEKTLYSIEREARRAFSPKENPPRLVVAVASDSVGNMQLDLQGKLSKYEERTYIEIFADQGHLSWHQDWGKQSGTRMLSKDECDALVAQIDGLNTDELQYLSPIRATVDGEEQIIGGGVSIFLRMDRKKGQRIYINNPPSRGDKKYAASSTIWSYTRLIEIVKGVRETADTTTR